MKLLPQVTKFPIMAFKWKGSLYFNNTHFMKYTSCRIDCCFRISHDVIHNDNVCFSGKISPKCGPNAA